MKFKSGHIDNNICIKYNIQKENRKNYKRKNLYDCIKYIKYINLT